MEKFFHLKENGTTVSTEIMAGLTTFFAMSYIIIVNPQILSSTGMPWGGVFLATIIAAIIGTLVMGLFANVPYAQAAGMGLNAFFTYTVCFGLGFSWQQTMCMVFLCGLINILITVTKIRKMIILAIPESLQHAIGGGIGLFVAYVGMLNVGLIKFTPGDPKAAAKGGAVAATPGLANFNDKVLWVFLIGLVLAIVFTVMKVKGGMLLAIAITTVIGIPFGVTTWSNSQSISETFSQLPQTFGAIFSAEGFPALFSDPTKLPLVIVTIFAFSMSDSSTPWALSSAPAAAPASSPPRMRRLWRTATASPPRWTRPCSPTPSPPPSAPSAAPRTPPPTWSPPRVSPPAAAPA